nr:GDP-mannose 4,6-dehydratase [Dehalobacter sp. DCA]
MYARPFNHFGPGQPRGFIVSDFASQIAQVEQGLMDNVIRVGDLGAKRDFTDVRDVVNAYALLMEKEVEPGIYNICSGSPRSAREILEFLIEGAKVPVHFQVDQERYRSSEVPFFVGSAEKIKKAVSWKINKDFFESLTETLGWWRTKKF